MPKAGRGPGLGSFMTLTVNFMIVAFVLFIVIRVMNHFKRKEAAAPASRRNRPREDLLRRIRDLLKKGEIGTSKWPRRKNVPSRSSPRTARPAIAMPSTTLSKPDYFDGLGGEIAAHRQGDDRGILRLRKNGELCLVNANIPEYAQANRFEHEPKRTRKLLVRKTEGNTTSHGASSRRHDAHPACSSTSHQGPRQDRLASPRAKSCMTSARPKRSATGSATRPG